jgi:uncharacterized membrane protein
MNAMLINGDSGPTRRVMMSVTVDRPAIRLYHEWRHLTRSQTAAARSIGYSAPAGSTATIRAPRIADSGSVTAGEAELSMEIPGLLIAWTSHPAVGSVQNGEVWFSPLPADRSEVRLILTWQALDPMEAAPGETAVQVERELTRFKQLMEQ